MNDTLFDHARRGDPRSSDRTVKSIVKDGSLAALILKAADWHLANVGWEWADFTDQAFCDTWLWEWIEQFTGRRHQRNVIARARGRLVDDGVLVGVGERNYNGVMLEHYVLFVQDPNNNKEP